MKDFINVVFWVISTITIVLWVLTISGFVSPFLPLIGNCFQLTLLGILMNSKS